MKEKVEFRIPEDRASRFLRPDEGRRLGDSVRALEVDVEDPLYERVGQLHRQFLQQGEYFFLGWSIRHSYTRHELESAEAFHLFPTAVFEPAGEECGTVYDESTACPVCRAGRTQVSDLILDLRKVPKNKDIAYTIASEWIVSQRLAELLVDANITGLELQPVHHKAYYRDDAFDLSEVPTGRTILRLAEEAGLSRDSWDFHVWLNRPGQKDLAERATEEYIAVAEDRDCRRHKSFPVWYQLVVTSHPVSTVPPTRFGIGPFDPDSEGRYRCPFGHTSGLNLLSEVWVSRSTWDESDIIKTADSVGVRRGLLVPQPLLLISSRLWHLLRAEGVRGYRVEVAHWA